MGKWYVHTKGILDSIGLIVHSHVLSIIRTRHSDLAEKMYYSVLPWNQFWILFDSCVSVCPLLSHFLLYPSPKLNRLSSFYSGYSWPWSAFWGKLTFSGYWKCSESRSHSDELCDTVAEPMIESTSSQVSRNLRRPQTAQGTLHTAVCSSPCSWYLSRCLTQWVLSEDQVHWRELPVGASGKCAVSGRALDGWKFSEIWSWTYSRYFSVTFQ